MMIDPYLSDLCEPDRRFLAYLARQLDLQPEECFRLLIQPEPGYPRENSCIDAGHLIHLNLEKFVTTLEDEYRFEVEHGFFRQRFRRMPLDLALLPALRGLRVSTLELLTLDVSGCKRLRALYCWYNDIETLDLTTNHRLRVLDCGDGYGTRRHLERLLLPDPCALQTLRIVSHGARFTPPDLDCCQELEALAINAGLAVLNLTANRSLRSLDLREDPDLELVLNAENRIEAFATSQSGNGLEEALSRLPHLRILRISPRSGVERLDLRGNTMLEELYCPYNELRSIALDALPHLHTLDLAGNQLRSLDISHNRELRELALDHNPMLEDIACTEEQKARLCALGGFFELTGELGARAETHRLHQRAVSYDWNEGLAGLFRIVTHHRCDLATALLVYWRGGANYYRQYERLEDAPASERPGFELVLTIEARVRNGTYSVQCIAFDPHEFQGEDLTSCSMPDRPPDTLRELPAVMYRALPGAK